jgi:hypothetical protein
MLFHPTDPGNITDGRARPGRLWARGNYLDVRFYLAGVLVTALGFFLQRMQDHFIQANVHLHFL